MAKKKDEHKLASLQKQVHALREALKLPPAMYPDTDDLSNKLHEQHEQHDVCPFCGSSALAASDYDGGRTLTCLVSCDGCGESWYEHYRFVGASEAEE